MSSFVENSIPSPPAPSQNAGKWKLLSALFIGLNLVMIIVLYYNWNILREENSYIQNRYEVLLNNYEQLQREYNELLTLYNNLKEEKIVIGSAYVTESGGNYVVSLQYVNMGMTSTNVDSIFFKRSKLLPVQPSCQIGWKPSYTSIIM
jgi:hypothetical protein